jgi:hypothetical protein
MYSRAELTWVSTFNSKGIIIYLLIWPLASICLLEIVLDFDPKNAQFQNKKKSNWNSSLFSTWAYKCH